MGRKSPCDLIQRPQGTASIRTGLRHSGQRWTAWVKDGSLTLGKRRRMACPEDGCICSLHPGDESRTLDPPYRFSNWLDAASAHSYPVEPGRVGRVVVSDRQNASCPVQGG